MNIVVAGSPNDHRFAVINFSNPQNPSVVLTPAPFLGGCVVDCSQTFSAVGNSNGTEVAIYDISDPTHPTLKSSISTGLGGIGALSYDGNRILAGELFGSKVVLIDASNVSAPHIASTVLTQVAGISSIPLSGSKAVASGPNTPTLAILDYSTPANPVQTQFAPASQGVFIHGSIFCDLKGTSLAMADAGDASVIFFDMSGNAPVHRGTRQTGQSGVGSISVDGSTVAVGSPHDATISVVDFQNLSNILEADLVSQLNGAATVKLADSFLVAGALNGDRVNLFSLVATKATLLGSANASIAVIGTLGFAVVAPHLTGPQISSSPTSLNFGTVEAGSTKMLEVTIWNLGTVTLSVTQPHSTQASFTLSITGSFNLLPGQSMTIQVHFRPMAAQSFNANLTMQTNDATHATFSVPLTGIGKQGLVFIPPFE